IKQVLRAYIFCGACGNNRTNRGGFQFAAARLPWFKADGLSIILVSSEMPEVLGMSDRIIVMHEGHLSGEFTREQATQEVLMAAAVGKLNRVNQE
ncbi:hypothetical protein ACQ7BZ_24095, partial [Escherichia coli]